MGLNMRKPGGGGCIVNNKGADQPVHLGSLYLLIGKYHIKPCCKRNLTILASLCRSAGWFESHFVVNPGDQFSRFEAHKHANMYHMVKVQNFQNPELYKFKF